tara:strand:+ start:122 stop:1150 length:1029 start_codon:yes stop_codon:yes gene_type:complete
MALNQVGLERLNTATTNKIGENKNLVINGQFDIWQRGTDSGSNTTDGILACDRWVLASSGATKQVTRQTFTLGQTDVPSNPKYFLRYAVTTGNNNAALRQRIEGVDRVQGTVTLTFYAKGTNPGGGSFNITNRQDFGTGGSASSPVDTGVGDFTVTTSWAKKTFTFTPPSISGKTLGTNNNSYYELEVFRQPASDTSTAAYTIDIANVQLEVGNVSTDFEDRSHAEELALCQRYYYRTTPSNQGFYGVGNIDGGSQGQILIHFPTEMRSKPTSLETTGTATDYILRVTSNVNCTGVPTIDNTSTTTALVVPPSSSHGLTDKSGAFLRAGSDSSFLGFAGAEL